MELILALVLFAAMVGVWVVMPNNDALVTESDTAREEAPAGLTAGATV